MCVSQGTRFLLYTTHLGSKCLSYLPQYFTPPRSRHGPEELVRFSRFCERSLQLLRGCLRCTTMSNARRSSEDIHTACTRASTSPVVGHRLSNTSPVPFHDPSYTPGISFDVGMSNASSIVLARLESERERTCTFRTFATVFLEIMAVGGQASELLAGSAEMRHLLGSCRLGWQTHAPLVYEPCRSSNA